MEAPLALYRRYRPETFAEVIGQEHVTAPLRNALSNNRVNHAYLFSGPRGCGKTTSARILARAINCEKGPIAEPCGVCKSCTDLARGGPGSIDVIEIDAASHGGVDDARDLRERAFFAPVESRYKIYIIDEAHMVTTQGFNALLKLVEEPPPHLKFIFATTEPDKVIGTIRSRTHHYPFRLVPPKVLAEYMATLCASEGVAIEPAALPLVVRAGAGSVRDSLSVLDQLIGGAGPEGVTYELAVALLGFTPDSLLDACVDGFAAHDSAAVFQTIEKVIETGQDPKRFAEDLLRRLRDLVILSAVPTAVTSGLIEAAEDQGERLQTQAAGIGPAELTRAADIVAAGLLDMRGATAPRLQLELICAKVLLPGADDSTNGIQARLDRMERRMAIGVAPGTAEPPPGPSGTSGYAQPDAPAPGHAADPASSRAAARAAATRSANPAANGPTDVAPTAQVAPAANLAPTAPVGSPANAAGDGSTGSHGPAADSPTTDSRTAPHAGGQAADDRTAPQAGGQAADSRTTPHAVGDADSWGTPQAGGQAADSRALQAGGEAAGQNAGAGIGTAGGAAADHGPSRSASGPAARPSGAGAGSGTGSAAGAGRTGAWGDESSAASSPTGESAPGQSAPGTQAGPGQAGVVQAGSVGGGAIAGSGAPSGGGAVGLADIRRLWPEVLEAVKAKRRFAWIMLSQNAQVIAIDDQTLTLGLVNAGARESFARSGSDEILRQAMIDTIGVNRRVEAVVDPSTDPGAGGGGSAGRPTPQPGGPSAGGTQPGGSQSGGWQTGGPPSGAPTAAGAPATGADGPAAGGNGPAAGGHGSTAGGNGSAVGGIGSVVGEAGGVQPGGRGAGGSEGGTAPTADGRSTEGQSGPSAGASSTGGLGGPGNAHAAGGGPGGVGGPDGSVPVGAVGAVGAAGAGGLRGAGGSATAGSPGSAGGPSGSGGPGGAAGEGAAGADRAGTGGGGRPWADEAGLAAVALQEPPDSEYDVPPGVDPWESAGGPEPARQQPAQQQSAVRQTGGQQAGGQQAGGQQAGGRQAVENRRERAASKRRAAEAAVAAEQAREAAAAAATAPVVPLTPEEEADAIGEDDLVLEDDSRSHTDLLRETLGAQIITEEPN